MSSKNFMITQHIFRPEAKIGFEFLISVVESMNEMMYFGIIDIAEGITFRIYI